MGSDGNCRHCGHHWSHHTVKNFMWVEEVVTEEVEIEELKS